MLEGVDCWSNRLTSVDLSSNTNLVDFFCDYNNVQDLGFILTNAEKGGLAPGSYIYVQPNPLSDFALTNQIPILQNTYQINVEDRVFSAGVRSKNVRSQ
jgi:hypothetical protein